MSPVVAAPESEAPAASAVPLGDEITLQDVAIAVRAYRRPILLICGVGLVLGSLTGVLQRRTWSSVTSFVPQAADSPNLARLSGLAAQLGLGGLAGRPGQSPDFYADLLVSRQVLGKLVDRPYLVPGDGGRPDTLRLPDVLDVGGRTEAERRENAIRDLRRSISVTTGLKTGIVQAIVSLPNAEVSRSVAEQMVQQLNDFNLRTRQTQAKAEREFLEGRLQSARGELSEAESRLQGFFQGNRDYRSSPALSFQAERLQREVQTRREMVQSLTQGLEQARLDEVRNTPVITLLERPERAVRANSRGVLQRGLLGLVLGLAVGATLALVRHRTGSSRWPLVRGAGRSRP